MATDSKLVQGQMTENPEAQQKDVERLMTAFLRALLEEQKTENPENLKMTAPLPAPGEN